MVYVDFCAMFEFLRAFLPKFSSGAIPSDGGASGQEQRSGSLASCTPSDLWGQPRDWDISNGVSIEQALSVPAVFDAVRKVSETLASLPLDIFLKSENGSEAATKHPVRYLIKTEPSPYVTSYDFRRAMYARACFGDSFAKIHRNGIGRPTRLEIMNGHVSVKENNDGGVYYVWTWSKGGNSGQEVLYPYQVMHYKGFSLYTSKGMDVTSAHKDTLGFSVSANKYGNAFFNNNASVDKVLTVPGALTPAQDATLQRKIQNISGARKSGSTMILDGGMDLKPIGLSPETAMLNESRSFQVNEVARVFGVPVHLLQNMDRATFNNIEMMTTLFVTLCLRPWAVQTEQEMFIKLLTREEKESDVLFFRHNFEGLLRGDAASRSAYYSSAILNGWMTRNEAREKENLNVLEGLDSPLVPVNMSIIGEDGEVKPISTINTTTTAQAGSGGKKADNGTPQNQAQ